jgi:hypothetical protein
MAAEGMALMIHELDSLGAACMLGATLPNKEAVHEMKSDEHLHSAITQSIRSS